MEGRTLCDRRQTASARGWKPLPLFPDPGNFIIQSSNHWKISSAFFQPLENATITGVFRRYRDNKKAPAEAGAFPDAVRKTA
jgi:hypothetical protein